MNKIISKINSAKDIEGVFAIAMLFVALILLSIIPLVTEANTDIIVEALPDNKVFNDFVVGPGKIEMELAPGEKGTFDLMISNRLGTNKTFSITEEDFSGSDDPDQTVVLLGNDKGPYSLKDYVKLGATSIDVEHGTRVRVPISVTVPKNAEPGGLYGSVIVGVTSKNSGVDNVSGVVSSNPVITRIGTLVFVRVKGDTKEDGKLAGFTIAGNKKIISDVGDLRFNILFQNQGNVHLNPKGTIVVKNLIGTVVGTLDVEPWFAMPKSLRFREVIWSPGFILGKYTAFATIERGYGEIKDEASVSFWFIPWKIIVTVFIGLFLIVFLIKKVVRRKSLVIGSFIIFAFFSTSHAEVMSSSNFKLEADSINFGGGRSLSGSYTIEDTMGEIATGISSSTNFAMKAGYQQNNVVSFSVTPASNVTMSPSIGGLTGGTANGQTSFTVTTDSPAGYTATIKAESSPALISAFDSFADYVPAGSDPDFTFTNSSDSSSFAFSPEGSDIATRYKNSGAVCGLGSSDTVDACWDGISITEKTILNRSSANQPLGTTSVIKFRATSGSSHVQKDGVYTATTTVTVLSL